MYVHTYVKILTSYVCTYVGIEKWNVHISCFDIHQLATAIWCENTIGKV